MKVVILCGGLGTRLREETEFRPKPMVEIGERPILWHIMKIFNQFGYNEFVLCLGYKGEYIKNYFYNYELMNESVTIELGHPMKVTVNEYHSEIGWKIAMVNTGDNTLKGGRIKKVEKYIDGDVFLLTYGDGLADVDINKLVEFHKSHGKMITVTGVNIASRFGELKIDGDKVTSFSEKPEKSNSYINGGFFVVNRKVFDYLSIDDDCDFEYGPLEKIAQEGQLMVYKHDGSWACMDTIRDVQYLNSLWNNGKAFWKNWG